MLILEEGGKIDLSLDHRHFSESHPLEQYCRPNIMLIEPSHTEIGAALLLDFTRTQCFCLNPVSPDCIFGGTRTH